MRFLFTPMMVALTLAIPCPALSQSADTKAILDALKGVNTRIDEMQKQIDNLRTSKSVSPEKAAPVQLAKPADGKDESKGAVAQPSSSGVPPGMKAAQGWVVSALPYVKNVREPDPLFRFSQPKLPINFDAHLKTRPLDDGVSYKAEAEFNVYETGRYILMALVMAPQRSSAWCGGYLKLGANTVIDLKSEFASSSDDATYVQDGKTRTIPVGLNLDQGNYDIAFLLACRPPGGKFSRSDSWEQTSFDIQIRGPNEEVPRSLEAREIFHFVKGGSEVKGAPSGSSSKRTGSEPPTMTDNTVEPSV